VVSGLTAVTNTISRVVGRRIWDSRGRPTVEVEVTLAGGAVGRGIAPAGASRGSNEAVDLRDGGPFLGGFDVARAVGNVRSEIAANLIGLDAFDQRAIDNSLVTLDGTVNKGRLGGNALIATSMAVLHAAAAAHEEPLWRYLARGRPVTIPLPQVQIFGGGAHAGRRVDIQDFLIMPISAASFDEAMVIASEVYESAGALMAEKGPLCGVADEGGWWPNFVSNEEALETLTRAIERAGYRNGEVAIALDVAASEFFRVGRYRLGLDDRAFTSEEWVNLLLRWIDRYPILSIEDPVAEDDTAAMVALTSAVGNRIQIIGDDFLVTNAVRVQRARDDGACNAVLVKPNQAGTISESNDALEAGQAAGWGTIISARSGETEDVTIAHLAVGWNAGQIKVGSFTRSERMAKWNELLRIEDALGGNAHFAGLHALPVSRQC